MQLYASMTFAICRRGVFGSRFDNVSPATASHTIIASGIG